MGKIRKTRPRTRLNRRLRIREAPLLTWTVVLFGIGGIALLALDLGPSLIRTPTPERELAGTWELCIPPTATEREPTIAQLAVCHWKSVAIPADLGGAALAPGHVTLEPGYLGVGGQGVQSIGTGEGVLATAQRRHAQLTPRQSRIRMSPSLIRVLIVLSAMPSRSPTCR